VCKRPRNLFISIPNHLTFTSYLLSALFRLKNIRRTTRYYGLSAIVRRLVAEEICIYLHNLCSCLGSSPWTSALLYLVLIASFGYRHAVTGASTNGCVSQNDYIKMTTHSDAPALSAYKTLHASMCPARPLFNNSTTAISTGSRPSTRCVVITMGRLNRHIIAGILW
jgi:hypothetical protein